MLAQHFVSWCETATVSERCAAVTMLVEAVVGRKFLPGDIRQAEAALIVAAADPSPRVRRTVSEGVCAARNVPGSLVRTLAGDIDEVALPVVSRSPLLNEVDLATISRSGRGVLCRAVARRECLPAQAIHEIVRSGDEAACLELMANESLTIEAYAFATLAQRFAGHGEMRHRMLHRNDLPSALRDELLGHLGQVLCASPLVACVLGGERSGRLAEDVRELATASVIEQVEANELADFVEHLRGVGRLNAAILVRAVCMGRIDLFAAALTRLTGLSERRVRAIVADAREPAFVALAAAAGLPGGIVPLLLSTVRAWKDMAGEDEVDPEDVATAVMDRVVVAFWGRGEQSEELSRLIHRLAGETQAQASRRRVGRYLAA
ncbi:DUF2336 domain-containing protein [Aureimonas sp. ME7]|uniref:DUF2336 domain-containing protein n=1 Tax=Aureimonas sp. ME7 TaxID=2744252 RepID=UPI0015F57845|nr:DUF2336 domain-containing protein [Aureimonas sp. ME7]